jgi:hypothetical protein
MYVKSLLEGLPESPQRDFLLKLASLNCESLTVHLDLLINIAHTNETTIPTASTSQNIPGAVPTSRNKRKATDPGESGRGKRSLMERNIVPPPPPPPRPNPPPYTQAGHLLSIARIMEAIRRHHLETADLMEMVIEQIHFMHHTVAERE